MHLSRRVFPVQLGQTSESSRRLQPGPETHLPRRLGRQFGRQQNGAAQQTKRTRATAVAATVRARRTAAGPRARSRPAGAAMDGVDRDEGMLLDAASTATRSAGEKLRSIFERHDKRGPVSYTHLTLPTILLV